jgi:hypothetical protein
MEFGHGSPRRTRQTCYIILRGEYMRGNSRTAFNFMKAGRKVVMGVLLNIRLTAEEPGGLNSMLKLTPPNQIFGGVSVAYLRHSSTNPLLQHFDFIAVNLSVC